MRSFSSFAILGWSLAFAPRFVLSNGCCSLDFKNCIEGCGDTEQTCGECDDDEYYFWLPDRRLRRCRERDSRCRNGGASNCCEGLRCEVNGRFNLGRCVPVDLTETKSPTGTPTKAPTKEPATSSTTAPPTQGQTGSFDPIQTGAPTKSPTKEPAMVSTAPPTQAQTGTFGSIPAGPYVTAQQSSETVTIPDPDTPDLSSPRSACPHKENGLLDWHDGGTWSAGATRSLRMLSMPQEGEDVTIPAGSRVLVSQSISMKLGIVTVPADSELIVGENPNGIDIDAKGFNILGKLTIGSETCRMETPVTITLHGSRPPTPTGSNPPAPMIKGISVEGGTLNLHGKRYFQTWSRLAKTVLPGDSTILLQHSVNWDVGQQIVLVTSAIKDSRDYNLNEVRMIEALHPNPPAGVGAVVYLTEPVDFTHIANQNYQVEVGLLSRTIVIQGAPDSEPTDPDPLDGSCMHPRAANHWEIYHETTMPCMDKELTGYGGHMMVHSGGVGHVEGVEMYRMGQTNFLGRYPMHFHLLGDCPSCYFKDSSVHHSFYRCISIHGTNRTTVTENVAFDIVGYCYYLEDGVEQENEISFNLAAHIHTLGPDMPWGTAQHTAIYTESADLLLPADVTAAGFYITNVYNRIVGNAASGGWAGFAFPSLRTPLQGFRDMVFRPSNQIGLLIDGNTAHSSGWWWYHASPFYIGGALYYNGNNVLEYNPGRSRDFFNDDRRPCNVNSCAAPYNNCAYGCPEQEYAWLRMTNTKAFLTAGVGLNSWSGRMEVIGFEAHDVRLAIESLSSGFWINDMLAVCRTGEDLGMQTPKGSRLEGSGFAWYDTGQSHIITDAVFRKCGFRSDEYDQYDADPERGCANDNEDSGCSEWSNVFKFLTHSDQFTPEIMQGTRNITFDSCGRRFRLSRDNLDTVSGRGQNWLDVDGSASGLGEETLIGSGLENAKTWWGVDDQVVYDEQAPLRFIKKGNGPERAIVHFRMSFDKSLHNQVGSSLCGNGNNAPCPPIGFMRHLGHKFSPIKNPTTVNPGLPVTANPDIVGPAGGFGWLLNFNQTAPRSLTLEQIEIDPSTTVLLSVPYPVGTSFVITASGPSWCWETATVTCNIDLTEVGSIQEVRNSEGNTYFVDSNGVLTLRVIQISRDLVGNPEWFMPTYEDIGRSSEVNALPRFERDGVRLPNSGFGSLKIQARCPSDSDSSPKTGYCSESVKENYDPDVCGTGFVQVAYDACCRMDDLSRCKYANGSQNF